MKKLQFLSSLSLFLLLISCNNNDNTNRQKDYPSYEEEEREHKEVQRREPNSSGLQKINSPGGALKEENKTANYIDLILEDKDPYDYSSRGYTITISQISIAREQLRDHYTDEYGKFHEREFIADYKESEKEVDLINGINWKKYSTSYFAFIADSRGDSNPTLSSYRATNVYTRPTRYYQPTYQTEETSEPFLIDQE